jgi:hypothetical protein
LEIPCTGGVGIFSYLGKHARLGDAVWIVPGVLSDRPRDLCARFTNEGYFQFYPAVTALRHNDIERIGFCPEAMRILPHNVRNIIHEDSDGRVTRWLITDGATVREPRNTLSRQEQSLPIGEIINTAKLRERFESGWTPNQYLPPSNEEL